MARTRLITSESVSEGHPDKMCDQISDAILDAVLEQDKNSRVACETLVKTGMSSSPANCERMPWWTTRPWCAGP